LKILTFILTLLFLFSSLYLTDQLNSVGNIIIALIILAFVPLTLLFKRKEFVFHKNSFLLIYLLVLTGGISAMVNSQLQSMITPFMFFSLYVAAFVSVPSLKKIEINNVIYKAIGYSHIPLILIPIFIYGFNSNPYRGIFYNPNSLGTIVATLFAVFFSVFLYNMEKFIAGEKKNLIKTTLFGQLLFTFFMFYLVIMSGSRTSFITTVIIMLVGLLFLTIRLIKENKLLSLMVRGTIFSIFGSIVIFLLVKFTSFYEYLYFNIIYKFERKANSGDMLDHRGDVWSKTINEAGFFGHGEKFFANTIGLGAHNTFISILGEYGWVFLILFMFLLLFIFISSFKYAISDINDKFKYLPLMLFFSFVTLSMGEGMLFKLSMIAMFFSAGATIRRKELLKKEVALQKEDKSIPRVRKRRKLVW
jgi:O-Antigen ligase